MKNVTEKTDTLRIATAKSTIVMACETINRLKTNDVPKKDVLIIARVAGVTASKKTPDLIPYCHPIPVDCVDIDYNVLEDRVEITATVTALYKTGVEMEALTAVSISALTIYDMLKPIDKNMEITSTSLVLKKGGKTDYKETLPKDFKAAVIVTSDGTYNKKRQDKSGKIICDMLKEINVENIDYCILPDEVEMIRNQLLKYAEAGFNLVVTTGGTGLGPRDVTVEATETVLEREMPAVVQAMAQYGQKRTPYAMLSRAKAGTRGNTVIVNMPGSSRGAKECMNAIFPALLHVYKMMRGGGH